MNQNVSLADESPPRSGGEGINMMGSELAWSAGNVVSDDQEYFTLVRDQRSDNTVCMHCGGCCEYYYSTSN